MAESPASSPLAPSVTHHPIVFFDGVCGLCNGVVDRMLRADHDAVLRFAPLQGETARALLPPQDGDPLRWTLVYLDERGLHANSDASLEASRRLGGAWRLLSWLRFTPRGLRDAAYRVVVRNRYRWFGEWDSCRVPTPEERARFLP